MNFALDDQQELLQRTAREWFEAHCAPGDMRRMLDGGTPEDRLEALAAVGFTGVLVPEAEGGSGLGVLDLAVVAEQAGRVLAAVPLVSSAAWAASLLGATDGDEAAGLLSDIAAGRARVSVVEEPGAPVIDAVRATAFVALGDEGLVLATPAEVELTEQPHLDPTRGLARVRPSGGTRIGVVGAGAVARARHVAEVVLAAEDLGTAARCLEMAVAYAKERVAFGRPIGSFQAVKHMCVDMFAHVEQLRSLVWFAAWSADHDAPQLPLAASAAKAYAAEAVELCASSCIQVHGGIGFTWDHDAHLFWRRAKVDRLLLGDAAMHQARVAELALAAS
jgi:alkylation response protein AidB-like acyl-CoA dehydrogenase